MIMLPLCFKLCAWSYHYFGNLWVKYFELKSRLFLSEQSRSFYFSESVLRLWDEKQSCVELENKQAYFVDHVRESENNLIEH